MADYLFTDQHEWVQVEDGVATMGISEFAATQLGDVVYVELPEAGRIAEQFKEIAVVESVKAASEVYAPVSGEVIAANQALVDEPALVNESPLQNGWLIKIRMSKPEELHILLDRAKYDALVEQQAD